MTGLSSLWIGFILLPAFGRSETTRDGVLVVDMVNLYGCSYYTSYKDLCRSSIFLLDKIYPDRTFPVVIQDTGGPEDESRSQWQLVSAGGENRFHVRMCGMCSHGPCCFYWKLKRHFSWSELIAMENTDADPEKRDVFHIKSEQGGYLINACNEYGSCRYEMTWAKWKSKPHLKYVYFHHYEDHGVKWSVLFRSSNQNVMPRIPFNGISALSGNWYSRQKTRGGVMVVKFYNKYGCRQDGYYRPLCNAPVFFLDKMNHDGTFPIVIQDRGGPEDGRRNQWELVTAGGENRFYVRMCGVCSHGPCCFYWFLKRHFTYSELVARENPEDSLDKKDMFHIKSERGGYVINACNDFGRCRYEMTWATWKNKGHLKWVYVHHYRNEGVKWRVAIQPSWKKG